ncbi:MAG: DedA family protein [Alphaproteobacteria bacterium]|nr:MAG: DedA family protein [Alphaproteobacteria bacterium]
MFDVAALISKYGYLCVFLGSMVEGESIVLTASMLAATGFFSLHKLMILSFLGTCIAEQIFYNVGFFLGKSILHKWHITSKLFNKIGPIILKNEVAYILSCRFIYGIRTVSPFLIGVAKVNPKKYFLLNIIASFIWALFSCTLGYTIGHFTKGLGLSFKYIVGINVIIIVFIIMLAKLVSKYFFIVNDLKIDE